LYFTTTGYYSTTRVPNEKGNEMYAAPVVSEAEWRTPA